MINKVIAFMIILLCGVTIKETIQKECPEAYKQYLNDRAKMHWYKRIWYMK